jgi:hypothetical protein
MVIAMNTTDPFRYMTESSGFDGQDAFVAVLPCAIATKQALLEALANVLIFPAYFGFNWDALFDCLRDFNWIKNRVVVLIHDELPALPEQELCIYVRLLRDSVLDWRSDEDHCFEVVFSQSDKEVIKRLL